VLSLVPKIIGSLGRSKGLEIHFFKPLLACLHMIQGLCMGRAANLKQQALVLRYRFAGRHFGLRQPYWRDFSK